MQRKVGREGWVTKMQECDKSINVLYEASTIHGALKHSRRG